MFFNTKGEEKKVVVQKEERGVTVKCLKYFSKGGINTSPRPFTKTFTEIDNYIK